MGEVDQIQQLITALSDFFSRANAQQPPTQTQANAAEVLVSQSLTFEPFNEEKETFTAYRQRLENFFEIKQLSGDTEEKKNARLKVLINCLGSKHYQLLSSLTAPELPSVKTYDELMKLLETHLSPVPNRIIEQHKFLSRVQAPNETISMYVASLRQLTTNCKFVCPQQTCGVNISNVFLRAQFIRGINDSTIREKLLQDKDLEFEKAVDIALAMEASRFGNKIIAGTNNVNSINKLQAKNNSNPKKFEQNGHRSRSRSRTPQKFHTNRRNRSQVNYRQLGLDGLCLKCGYNNHHTRDCRKNRESLKCTSCNKIGHVAKVCITTITKQRGRNQNQQVSNINTETFDDPIEHYQFNVNKIIDIRSMKDADTDRFMATIKIGTRNVNFEIDTGSPYTLINENDFKSLGLSLNLNKTDVIFRSYNGVKFAPLGITKVQATFQGKTSIEDIYVVPSPYAAIIGRKWVRRFGIVKVSEPEVNNIAQISTATATEYEKKILQDFKDTFEEKLGCVPNYACSLPLKDSNTSPVFLKSRPIPYALQDKVEAELTKLETDGVIEKVDYSEWGSPLVCIPKADGNVRLCVDYKNTVNPKLQNATYPIPLIDDVLHKLRGSSIFCILDIHKAFHTLPVDEAAQKLQTISTHKGTFKMKRLAFGIKIAPNEFHKFIDTALQGLEGVVAYFDDIVVHASSLEECNKRLISCLERLRKLDLHINKSKCTFFAPKIKYLGHIISEKGIEKAPEKVNAIINAPRPKNLEELRSFIGYVTYYGKFIKNVSTIMSPIYELLNTNAHFIWTAQCEAAFIRIKQEIGSERVLAKFDPKLPLILATDASPVGISAVLSHIIEGEERPIAFASRALTKSEKNYSQLDKEATAIYWAFHKFYIYIYGRKFTLITDNKPLFHIFGAKQKLPNITASRLIRYAMFLTGFDYDIKHRQSKDHANADYLSRAPLPITNQDEIDEDYEVCNVVIANITEEPVTFETIKNETENEDELKTLKLKLEQGIDSSTEFSLHNGVIFRGTRVYIPKSLRKHILNELHATHQGIVRMKSLARRYCYWPHIDEEIESLVKACQPCAEVKKNPKKMPLHTWEIPEENWSRIHIDYAGPFQGYNFLIVVDARSKWPEIIPTKSPPTSAITILFLKEIFSRNGIPQIIASDNATIFCSQEFKNFCCRNGIRQCFIAPGHPATNGQAERFVQTMKLRLKSMVNDPGNIQEKLYEILLRYRATPLSTTDKSPAEQFMNRNLRTRLDLIKFQPSLRNKAIQPPIRKSLCVGDRVQSKNYSNSQNWKFGTITEKLGRLHYRVKLDDGYIIKRHIDQLRLTEVQKDTPKRVTFALDQSQSASPVSPIEIAVPVPRFTPRFNKQVQSTSENINKQVQPTSENIQHNNKTDGKTENVNSDQIDRREEIETQIETQKTDLEDKTKANEGVRRSTRTRRPIERLNL